jgi:hypothetical protein
LLRPKAANGAILATGPEVAQPFRMADDHDGKPAPGDHKARERARLAAALRENLKRRKAQARGRASAESADKTRRPHDSAGIGDDKQSG